MDDQTNREANAIVKTILKGKHLAKYPLQAVYKLKGNKLLGGSLCIIHFRTYDS